MIDTLQYALAKEVNEQCKICFHGRAKRIEGKNLYKSKLQHCQITPK